jgi:hypothetical protein
MAVYQLQLADGARRRLRRDIAALVARMREHLAGAPRIDRCEFPALVVTHDTIMPRRHSAIPKPTTRPPRHDERERRQLTDRFGAELQRVLRYAETLGAIDDDASSAINAGLCSARTLHDVAVSLEALARRI